MHAVLPFIGRLRGRHLFAIDVVGIVVAAYAALVLRFDGLALPFRIPAFPEVVLILIAGRTIANTGFGLYSRRWRFASVADLERIVLAVLAGSLAAIVVFYVTAAAAGSTIADGFPRSFWVIEALLCAMILGGTRFGIRAYVHHHRASQPDLAGGVGPGPKATLLYGAGETGVILARSAQQNPRAGVLPVGFLDDDPDLAGGTVAGLRVFGGLRAIADSVAATRARTLLITMPSAPGSVVRRIVEAAADLHLEVRTVPSMLDLLDGSVDAYRVRRVRVEDLLRRPMVTVHDPAVDDLIRDQVVLITGGGGSIGSELARQVFSLGPRRLVLVDRAESPLYLVQRELESRRRRGQGSGALRVHLANVASRCEMERFVARERPGIIFHAAAYKHVPLMEEHPSDAVHVNIGGTLSMLDAAMDAGVPRFVFVSTDKAVRPSSVMGASKRVAEMLVADAARRTGRPYVSVRFGNVLGSSGSVVPILREQLENGEPLTITDPEMTRYFMTIPEAAWLILDAAALGRDGDLFVLDMGQPIRVLDLALDLARLAGRDPGSQPIEVVGLRPGEKLHEQLFYESEHVEETHSPKVLRAHTAPVSEAVRDDVRTMLDLATGENDARLRSILLEYVRAADAAPGRTEPGDTSPAAPMEVNRPAPFPVPVEVVGAR